MNLRSPAFPLLALCAATVSVALSACGTSGESLFNDVGDGGDSGIFGGQNNGDGSFGASDTSLDPDAFFAKDPPPMWCGADGGGTPPPTPGGTVDCPDDKNREGCACPEAGKTAACWPGLRANRNMGVCKDGVTTCQKTGELSQTWGPCVGYVAPTPGATAGKAACKCFSEGQWKIENLVPYFMTYNPGALTYAMSTTQDPVTGAVVFPTFPPNSSPPPPKPSADWSKDSLKVDCAGHFDLCYELKAGSIMNPQPTDCVVAKVCTGGFDYVKEDVEQTLPTLKAWMTPESGSPTAAQSACAVAFHENGGYGEMSVVGKSVLCDAIDDGKGNAFVFNRIQYCKAKCNLADAGADPDCAKCGQDGSGVFH